MADAKREMVWEVGIPSDSVELPLYKISPTQDDLIATIFPDPDNPVDDCAILATRNIDCEAINETILSRVSGAVTELLSADKLLDALEEERVARRTSDANLHHNCILTPFYSRVLHRTNGD
jgi:hypothetical protein